MDRFTSSIIIMPVPIARPVVPLAVLESKVQFPNQKFISAVTAGHRSIGTKATGTDTDHDTRRTQAKVHMFRYGSLPEVSRCAITDITPSNKEVKYLVYCQQFDAWVQEWQNSMMSTRAGDWFPTWVSHEVTKYNYQVHLGNMARQVIRYSYDPLHFQLPQRKRRSTNIHRNKFPALVASHREHLDKWARDVESQYDIAMECLFTWASAIM
ncbi:MAG: hypothetical protein Q9184_003751 [Pyrenodesmia sp. 2 TL-2023]